jgi:hypothetical protein
MASDQIILSRSEELEPAALLTRRGGLLSVTSNMENNMENKPPWLSAT